MASPKVEANTGSGRTVILFGGGDAGGLIITASGVRPIPPFSPDIMGTLKSAAAIVNAIETTSNKKTAGKMAKLAISLCNLAVEQMESVVGPLDPERSIVFQDEDGGFTCGSTGKPPIPLPWPPLTAPSVRDLIRTGVVEADLIELVGRAQEKKISLDDIFENPQEVAKKLGLKISDQSVRDLQFLAPSQLKKIEDPIDREIVSFFHKVIDDGRFIATWHTRPYEVARMLKVALSEAALARVASRGSALAFANIGGIGPIADFGGSAAIVIAAIVVVTIVCLASLSRTQLIIDRSQIEKF